MGRDHGGKRTKAQGHKNHLRRRLQMNRQATSSMVNVARQRSCRERGRPRLLHAGRQFCSDHRRGAWNPLDHAVHENVAGQDYRPTVMREELADRAVAAGRSNMDHRRQIIRRRLVVIRGIAVKVTNAAMMGIIVVTVSVALGAARRKTTAAVFAAMTVVVKTMTQHDDRKIYGRQGRNQRSMPRRLHKPAPWNPPRSQYCYL